MDQLVDTIEQASRKMLRQRFNGMVLMVDEVDRVTPHRRTEAFRVDDDDYIDLGDVESALDQVVRYVRRNNYLKDILRRANSGRDEDILRAMAEIDGEVKAVRQVAEKIGVQSYRFGSNMTRLVRRDVLTRERPGQYRFNEPLLEICIRRVGVVPRAPVRRSPRCCPKTNTSLTTPQAEGAVADTDRKEARWGPLPPIGGSMDDLMPKSEGLVPRAEVAVTVDADSLPAPVRDALAPGQAAPPVAAQRASHVNAAKLESEKVVVAAPLSYAGSAGRIWKLVGMSDAVPARIGLAVVASVLIVGAWAFVTAWYLTWGLLLVPYRLIRRGSRKRKREALQHREMMAAIQSRNDG